MITLPLLSQSSTGSQCLGDSTHLPLLIQAAALGSEWYVPYQSMFLVFENDQFELDGSSPYFTRLSFLSL